MYEEKLGLLNSGKPSDFHKRDPNSNFTETAYLEGNEVSTDTKFLARVIQCYLNGEHLLSLRWELIKQIGLIIVALSGASLYGTAADQYSLSLGYDSWGMRANFVFSTCLSSLVVLYNSTDIFFNQQWIEKIPITLVGLLNQLRTGTQQRLKNVGLVVAAAISALPLALLSFTYPIPNIQIPAEIALAIVVEIDNTILHFLPIELALQNKVYRLPFLPFEYAYKFVVQSCLTPQEREHRKKEKLKLHIFSSMKQRLIRQLTLFQQRIAIYGFCFNRRKLVYENLLPSSLYFRGSDQDVYFYLESIISFHCKPYRLPRVNVSNFRKDLLNKALRLIFYILGAFWVVMGISGYLIAPVLQINRTLEKNNTFFHETGVSPMLVACLVSCPSIYFFGILLAFYGGNAMRDAYDYFTSWSDDDVKIPLEFKLYPKTFLALLAFNVYLLPFCYAATAQLATDNLTGLGPEALVNIALWSSKAGVIFLSLSIMTDFYRKVIDRIVLYRTKAENNALVRLNATIDQLKAGVVLMVNEKFLESLSVLSPKQLQVFLDLNDAQSVRDLETELRSLISLYFKDAYLKKITMQLLRKIVLI